MLTFSDIPHFQTVQQIAKAQRLSVFLVGGYLRDSLLGRRSVDYDFAVSRDALKFSELFAKEIKGAFVLLDKERECARIVKKIKGESYTYDFANFREKTLLQDLRHRDFTINTFSVDISQVDLSDNIKDCINDYQKGLKSIISQKIQMVSTKAFKEDPLRILRAYSLKAILGFNIDAKTLAQIKKDVDLIRTVSFERISVEFFKILEADKAAAIINQIDQIKLLDKIIPQVAVMYQCKQGPYHHLDVWRHSKETVKQLELIFNEYAKKEEIRDYLQEPLGGKRSRKALMKLAALLHDIGKPDTRKIEQGKYSFHAHEHVGKKIVKPIARMLKISTRERYALQDMVQLHLRPGYLSNYKRPTERAIYRFFRDAKEEAVSVLLLSLADQRSTRGPLTTNEDQRHHEKICHKLIKEFFAKQKEKPLVKLINGHDIMKKLKMKPSSLIGEILREVEEKQSLGKINNKIEALEYAKNYYASQTKLR